ncbi:hypothetical protein EC973_000919 [Apophysomyces ossiformis]|uniref:Uncharacterized protein n=1 Tax=Apophysomyces ossiformis TaxID=679940 RepID=A0A8H7EPP4_9FUNG|nr:hypothetical protein EC973_000919 [Apophysomyces ossiformis]
MRWMYLLMVLGTSYLPYCLASSIKNLVVFDVGNAGRSTNGPLWSENLAVGWNASLYNFAFDGAVCDHDLYKVSNDTIPSIKDQIEIYYRQELQLTPAETVYAIWVGMNDIERAFQDQNRTDQVPDLTKTVECIGQQMRNIRKVFGSNRFLILSVPPMDRMPFFHGTDLEPIHKKASIEFNRLLAAEIEGRNKNHHGVLESDFVDVHRLLNDIVADPQLLDYTNAVDAYWAACQGQCDDSMDSYLWWDSIHITGGTHRLIANSILLSSSFEPATSLDESMDVQQLILDPKSRYHSPIYKPALNTGLIDQVIEKKEADKKKEGEQVEDMQVDTPKKEEHQDEEKEEHDTITTDAGSDGYSFQIYIGLIGAVVVCVGFIVFVKTHRSGGLSILSRRLRNNQGRGAFVPLRNIETQP